MNIKGLFPLTKIVTEITIKLQRTNENEQLYLLGYNAVWFVESQQMFRGNMSPLSSGFLKRRLMSNGLQGIISQNPS
jgi:hypothetical protein